MSDLDRVLDHRGGTLNDLLNTADMKRVDKLVEAFERRAVKARPITAIEVVMAAHIVAGSGPQWKSFRTYISARRYAQPWRDTSSGRRSSAAMNARDRDLSRLLSAVAAEAGARLVAIKQTRHGHRKVRFQDRAGGNVIVIAGGTPSDVAAVNSEAGCARRQRF